MFRVKTKNIGLYLGILITTILVVCECYFTLNNYQTISIFIMTFMIGIGATIFSRKKCFIAASIIFMFFICGLREPIFTDDYQYARMFHSINGVFLNIFANQNEKGYLFLNYVISVFTDEYKIAQIIIIGFGFVFLYKGIARLQVTIQSSFIIMYYFFVVSFRFSGAGLVRIQIAVSIFIYAMSCLEKRNLKKFVLMILIASFFHRSSLAALILLLPFCMNNYVRNAKYNHIFLLFLTVLIFSLFDPFITFLASYLGGKYSQYTNISNFSLSILSIFYICTFAYAISIKKYIDQKNIEFYEICLYMFLIAIIFDVFFAFGRINFYFLFSFSFILGFIWKNSEKLFPKITCGSLFLFFIVMYFQGGQLSDIYIVNFFENYKNMLFK